MIDCPACQSRGQTLNNVTCPWCEGKGGVVVEVARAYWRIREVTRFRFHNLFGARVPLDDAHDIHPKAELEKLNSAEPAKPDSAQGLD